MKKKILFVLPLTSRGGVEAITRLYTQQLQQKGYDIKIALLAPPLNMEYLQDLDYHIMTESTYEPGLKNISHNFFDALFRLRNLLLDFKPDFIICTCFRAFISAKLTLASVSLHSYILVWEHSTLTNLRKYKLKLYSLADGFIAISNTIRRQALANISLDNHKIHLLYNGIESPENSIPFAEKATFLYVSRLQKGQQKATDDFIRGLALVKGDWSSVIIGDGDDRQDLTNLADELGIGDRISWLGWQSKPWDVVDKASVLVLSSRYEGFPLVLIEALLRGIPCISSDCPTGPNEIIAHGLNGWLYPLGDINALAAQMQKVVQNPKTFTLKAIQASVADFTIDNAINQLEKILSTFD